MTFPRSNSSILRLGDEAIMHFVELCRKEECLWNSNIPEYKNKAKRHQATIDIARELNVKDFESQHVWLKFRNLRNTYCQELKKISASGGTYAPKVIWFSKMDSFLRPHIQSSCILLANKQTAPQESVENTMETLVVKQENSDDDSDDIPLAASASLKRELSSEDETPGFWPHPPFSKLESQRDTETEDNDLLQPSTSNLLEPSTSNLLEPSTSNLLEPSTSTKRHAEDTPNVPAKQPRREDDMDRIVVSLNHISEQVQLLRPHVDMFDRFGRYIASLLRSLPRKKGLLLQPQIVNLITVSAALNLPDRPLP